MTPPVEAADAQSKSGDAGSPAVLHVPVTGLRNRSDFLRAARARREATPGFILQGFRRPEDEAPGTARIGFTCSKKVGNAVARNRAKRRLREIARIELPVHGKAGWDYVLIGRRDTTAARNYSQLRSDLVRALSRLHGHKK